MKCLKCGIPLYEAVDFCPSCGAPQRTPRGQNTGRNAVVILLGLGLFVTVIVGLWPRRNEPTRTSAPLVIPSPPAPAATPWAGVTMADYDRLETGMSYKQAVEILGKPGKEISSGEMAGIRSVMYMWEGESLGANMNAMFQNDKLTTKAQFGLR